MSLFKVGAVSGVERARVQIKSNERSCPCLKWYDNRRETWPKCRHGEDCLVQMCTDGMDGGQRFFK